MRTQICGLRVVMSEHVNTLPHFSFENVSKLIEAMKTLLSACEDIADFNLIIPRTAELTIDEGIQSAVVRIHADLTHNVSVDDNMNHILFTLRYQPTETSSEFAISVESATLADKRYVLSLPLAIDDSLSYGIAFPIQVYYNLNYIVSLIMYMLTIWSHQKMRNMFINNNR